MTVAGDRARPRVAALALLTAAALLLAACTSEPGSPAGDGRASSGMLAAAADAGVFPAADEQAIRDTIDRLNAAAGGAVADQQAVLHGVVDPALRADLDRCPVPTTTVRFQPVYPGLRPEPGWTADDGPLTGTVYALPSLIRSYTGERITGTDLTTLHVGVTDGEAYLTPLCVG